MRILIKTLWFCGRTRWWRRWPPSHWTCGTLRASWSTAGRGSWGARRGSSSPPWRCRSRCRGCGNVPALTHSPRWTPSSDPGSWAARRCACGRGPRWSGVQYKIRTGTASMQGALPLSPPPHVCLWCFLNQDALLTYFILNLQMTPHSCTDAH